MTGRICLWFLSFVAIQAFAPLPPPTPGGPVFPPVPESRVLAPTSTGKCTLYNSTLPCEAGSECIPKTACLFPSKPKGREYYCPCANGTCANCMNETACLDNARCGWNGVSCYNECDMLPCRSCINDFSCNGHISHNCFWANYTNNNTGSCEPIVCRPGTCHCPNMTACNNLPGCQWTPDGRCGAPVCATNPMDPICLIEEAFLKSRSSLKLLLIFSLVPPRPDRLILTQSVSIRIILGLPHPTSIHTVISFNLNMKGSVLAGRRGSYQL